MSDYLYEHVRRVPEITDDQIAEMRHIEPVLRIEHMYRRIKNADAIDPRDESCIWNAEPTDAEPFTVGLLDSTTIITQHRSSVFFKPSLAEVYAWIRVFVPEHWNRIRFFYLGEAQRVPHSTDCWCECELLSGAVLVRGEPVMFANGEIGHKLERVRCD